MSGNSETVKICENCSRTFEQPFVVQAKDFRKNRIGKTEGDLSVCELCHAHFSNRSSRSQEILSSKSPKRLIVAGPGTGKTFTFGEVIKALSSGSSALVFTLINNLADELERDLGSIKDKDVKVNTLHGYCKELLHSKVGLVGLNDKFSYSPLLPTLVEEDSALLGLGFSKKDFSSSFANLDEGSRAMDFYLTRTSYYNAASHIDSIYRVFTFFNANGGNIPAYGIVIADEYQDFNKLESEFISLLATKSPTLLAGDDDQALYGFREAKKDFIRSLHNDDPEYDNKYLPYCSRCTPVIVEATNKLVEVAQGNGLLDGRIQREFTSYWPDKYIEHSMYPHIDAVSCSRLDTVSKYVESRILRMVAAETITANSKDLPFMIIGPESGFHLDKVKEHLLKTLDPSAFEVVDSRDKEQQSDLLDGYELLRQGVNKNLGWRIVLHVDPLEQLPEIIRLSHEEGQNIEDLLPPEYIKKHLEAANQKESDAASEETDPVGEPKKIKIFLTNFLGSKGLAALHVVVIGMNNYTFPTNPASVKDEEVCKFIVALTRAKNSCALVTNKEWDKASGKTVNRPSMFFSWLPKSLLNQSTCRVKGGNLVEE